MPISRAGSITLTPITGIADQAEDIKLTFLQLLVDLGISEMRSITHSGIFKHPTGALGASYRGRPEAGNNAVLWWSDSSHAGPQEFGVSPHQMWYLLNATIPLKMFKNGQEITIFRKASLQSLLKGKWYHPGYPGKFIMKRGILIALDQIPDLLIRAKNIVLTRRGVNP